MPSGFRTEDGVDFNEVYYDGIVPMLQRYNEVDGRPDFRELLCEDADEKIKSTILATTDRMQKLAPNQTPDSIKTEIGRYQGLSEFYGTGQTRTWDYLRNAKADDILRDQANIFTADKETIHDTIVKAVLVNPAVAPTAVSGALYNGYYETYEGIATPPKYKTNSFQAGHIHYVTSGATSFALNDFDAAETHLREHGVKGDLLAIMHNDQWTQIKGLAAWTASGAISNPITDKIAVEGFVDKMSGWNIIVDDSMPTGYVLWTVYSQGGRLMKFHESNNGSFRGLLIIEGSAKYPLVGSYYFRFFNPKVYRRDMAVAMQITNNADYTNPTL